VSRRKRTLSFIVTAVTLVGLVVLVPGIKKLTQGSLFSPQPAIAQSVIQESIEESVIRPGDVWQQVYKQLPNLPLENKYVSKDTGKVDPDNTLVSRLIRYHIYVKGRPAIYRLDWKLTLADYLGMNEELDQSRYPGSDSLRQNPIEGDRAAIGHLNRVQRDALVQVLVNIFNPNSSNPDAQAPSAVSQPRATPKPSSKPIPPQSQPGGAHLLVP